VYGGIAAHAGDLFFDNAQSLRSSGRLHIATEERLYLLAKGAVYLTADWGGPGDLYTSGSIYCAGRGPGDRPTGHGAGIITWDVEAKGGVYSPHKQFVIDHPLDPDGRHLVHACIEGPEYAVYYRGEGVLENGEAQVALPDYFEALTHTEGRTVQLTPKVGPGGEVPVLGATAVADGRFTVRAPDHPHPDQGFFWEIKAVRADIEALAVELIKRDVAVPA
jgi:hypothetical protein